MMKINFNWRFSRRLNLVDRLTARHGLLAVYGAVGLLCLFLLLVFGYGDLATGIASREPAVIDVRPGDSLTIVAQRLARKRLLANPGMFRLLAVARGAGSIPRQPAPAPRG